MAPAPEPTTDPSDPELAAEERSLKREELAARREEAQAKLLAARAPWWRRTDPLVLAVSAGAITLAGNMFVAWYNAQTSVDQENIRAKNTLAVEKEKAKANLIIQALSTSDAAAARRNLLFFVHAGLIADADHKIEIAAEKYGPVLPSASGAARAPPTTSEGYSSAFWSATVRPDWLQSIDASVTRIVAAKPRLEALARAVHSPWYVIGVFWMEETGGRLDAHFNGDPLTGRTIHFPTGRPLQWPPPNGEDPWVYSAVDQITFYKLNNLDNASLGEILNALERANGLGYQRRGLFSPYLWSGTSLYEKGKYLSDHVYDPNVVSAQVGVAAMLRRMQDKKIIDLTATAVATGQ